MTTLKVIFDFILSVVKVFFPGKDGGRHCRKDHPVSHPHRLALPPAESDGSSPGRRRGDIVGGTRGEDGDADGDADDTKEEDRRDTGDRRDTTNTSGNGDTANRLMGQALIATAIVGYIYKMVVG